jgi:hypothetical protein
MKAPRLATGAPSAKTDRGQRSAGSTSMRFAERDRLPHLERIELSSGASVDGNRVKSGQITPLKMWCAGRRWWRAARAPDRRVPAIAHHAVGQETDGQHVVEVRMADQDVVDRDQFVERQITHAGSGVNQHVVVEQERRGAALATDGARTAEDAYLHENCLRRGDIRRASKYQ